jgi:hypothetical protein
MGQQQLALKMLVEQSQQAITDINDSSDEELRARLQFYIDTSGQSEFDVCRSMKGIVAGAHIHDFLLDKPTPYPATVRQIVSNFLAKKEDRRFPIENPLFCETSIATKMGAICSCCKHDADVGIIVGASGLGKTEFLRQLNALIGLCCW